MRADKDFPLLVMTPDSWASLATEDLPSLLNDHAHLEKKAATNALDIFTAWPGGVPSKSWLKILGAIASDEISHLNLVVQLMAERGAKMTKAHRSLYASQLRQLVRRGEGPNETTDRLLISAIIEARSAERFYLLANEHSLEPKLKKVYKALYSSERGHFQVFKELASELCSTRSIDLRWQELALSEAKIISSQPAGGLHGWVL